MAIDQARVATLTAKGLARAGTMLGTAFQQYRATGADQPLLGAPIGTIQALFDPSPTLELVEVEDRHGSGAYLIGDPSGLAAGDYLVGSATWFISHIEPLRPASCTLCNHTVAILQPDTASDAGTNSYGGRTLQSDTPLASGWPASLLARSHIEMDPTRLPSDVKVAFFEVLLPAIPGLQIAFGMRLSDENGLGYAIASAELSLSGWKLTAVLQTT